MKLVNLDLRQRHARSCGATVVARVAGVSLDEAERMNGKGATTTRRLVGSLAQFGLRFGPRMTRLSRARQPKMGDICCVHWSKTRSHLVLKTGERAFFDPAYGVDDVPPESFTARGGRITSFLRRLA